MSCNFLTETIDILTKNGKTVEDIVWFGEKDMKLIGNIEEIFNFSYDDGCGGSEINDDLLVVGNDWWLERHEYVGHEWWEFKQLPMPPIDSTKTLTVRKY